MAIKTILIRANIVTGSKRRKHKMTTINEVNIYPVYIPFKYALESTWNLRSGVLSFVIRIKDSNGNVGYGDCLCKQLNKAGWEILKWASNLLIGKSIYQIEEFKLLFDGLGRWTWKHDLSFVGHPLMAGIEIALWDLIGKRHKRPVYDFFGGIINKTIYLTYQIPTKPIEKLEENAEFAKKHGFNSVFLKLAKINRNLDEDVESVERVRQIVGDNIQITVDVNGAWTLPTAIRALKKLEPYDLAYVESPVIGVENLANLRKRTCIPIAADEESCSFRKLMQLIRNDAVDVVILDLPSFGGISGMKKAVDLLEIANIPVVIHANGELLTSFASFQLAASHPGFKYFAHQFYHELGESFVHEISPEKVYTKFELTDKAGLGFNVNEEKLLELNKLCKRVEDAVDIRITPGTNVPSFPKY